MTAGLVGEPTNWPDAKATSNSSGVFRSKNGSNGSGGAKKKKKCVENSKEL